MTAVRGAHYPKPMEGKIQIAYKQLNPLDYDCADRTLGVRGHIGSPIKIKYRTNSTDELVLKETLTSPGWYRRPKLGFDVEKGEQWLDLGANIGAFAIYCWLRGATAMCFEPDKDNFNILRWNLNRLNERMCIEFNGEFGCRRSAVTASKAANLAFYKGRAENDFYKYSPIHGMFPYMELPNTYAGPVFKPHYDGCKMDIEGSEYALLDAGLVPNCDKLVIEYHLRRNPDMKQFRRRMDVLRKRFKTVHYPKSLNRLDFPDDKYPGFFDRLIFCYNH